jgi:hypothetical protein
MHPYLTRIGIKAEVQHIFAPFTKEDTVGDLLFDYGDGLEHFSLAFHRVPVSVNFWMAGNRYLSQVAEVIISGSALDAVSWLNKKSFSLLAANRVLFLATGAGIHPFQLQWLRLNVQHKSIRLLYGKDLLGRITDLKIAATLRAEPLEIFNDDGRIVTRFRNKSFSFSQESFSVNAFEKASGYRFNLACDKPHSQNTFIEEAMAAAGLIF